MISTWLRVIRVRFLLSSVIAVGLGLTISWITTSNFDVIHAIMTMIGVIALHASVDLLNDYWDFKRGIDLKTQRTKMSGGTGVLPEGLLRPEQVYRAGIISLIIGSAIGAYFIIIEGIIIAVILGFAILSIYFYSTKIVNAGLAEFFVAVKGTLIVLGTFFIQTTEITETAIMGGMVIGILSSLVLYITSFPDYIPDKEKGRKTLIIILGQKLGVSFFWVFPSIVYGIIIFGVFFEYFPLISLITIATIPWLINAGLKLRDSYDNIEKLIPIMNKTLIFSRITGVLLLASFLIPI